MFNKKLNSVAQDGKGKIRDFTSAPIVPLLAELVGRGDGTYILKPRPPGPDLDSWITIAQAAEIMENVHPRCLYRFLGEYLVYRRPLPRKVLVSLESVLALKKATLDPEFWDNPSQKERLKSTVRAAMDNLSRTATESSLSSSIKYPRRHLSV
jgi:hypothetical protein